MWQLGVSSVLVLALSGLASICLAVRPTLPKICKEGNRWLDERDCISVGERSIRPGELAWLATISTRDEAGTRYICDGSLIHPQAVLTSAYCVHNKSSSTVGFKIRTDRLVSEIIQVQDNILRVIVHENYDREQLRNNLAIIIVSEPFVLNDFVDVVDFPKRSSRIDFSKCVSSGFEAQEFQPITMHPTVIDESTCRDIYADLEPGSFCSAGKFFSKVTRANTGSPLVCPTLNYPIRYVQIGLLSSNWKYSETSCHLFWTNVSVARSWIDEKLAENYLL